MEGVEFRGVQDEERQGFGGFYATFHSRRKSELGVRSQYSSCKVGKQDVLGRICQGIGSQH